uniref:Sperm flagellar protein 1-like n=1 Tax=Ursus maritimus TaxID=29073 RepID=A0A452TZF7_URSMA
MLAEIVKHFYPRLVDLHNYVPTCNTDQKLSNWSVLNRKVFHKLRLWVSETEIQKVVANTPGAIEPILLALREKVKDGAVQQAPPPTADPGPSSADANSPQAQLTTPAHTGLQGPTVPSGVKTLPSQRTPERTGHCVYIGQDPADGSLEHLDSGLQQLLEEKEQALVVLQEMVKEKVEDDGSSQLAWETQSRAAASLRCPQRLCKGHRTLKDPPTKCSGVGLLPPGPAPPGNTEARPGGGRRGSRRVDLPQGRGHPTSRPF